MLQLMAGAERLCHIFKWGRELISYFQMGLRDEKGWEPLGYRYAYGSWNKKTYEYATCDVTVTHDKSAVGLVETK